MASPYGVTIEFTLEGTGEEVFHPIEGVESAPREGETIYFNDVGYKVESSTLYLYDNDVLNPTSGVTDWFLSTIKYKVVLSVLP